MRFNNFAIIIFEILLNNYVSFKLNKIDKKLKINYYYLIINIFALNNIFKIKFQHNNKRYREIIFFDFIDINRDYLIIDYNKKKLNL